jgi:D-beta-D-heptose 7-phosphate kinase/D-beta-D-heptose 1-phosphate adenosyltransferase
MKGKIKTREELQRLIHNLKRSGKRIVFTNGCFDILHVGHVRYLEQAKSLGDVLVVGINSDRSVRGLKGPRRPILPVEERGEILSGLGCTDYITVFEEPTPFDLISLLQPDVLVKGGDWTPEQVVGREVVEGSGGRVVILPFVEGSSTTNIIDVILEKYEERS